MAFRARLSVGMALAALAASGLLAAPLQTSSFVPIDDVRPGMVGTGRTVFAGDALDEFQVNIIGVLRNAIGPNRDLILARLEGGPLANTGVIEGMSGSPVYVNGRLLGAISYSLGSFPKEPLAGITPIAEMTTAINTGGPRTSTRELAVNWPAPATEVFAALSRLATRAAAPLGDPARDGRLIGPASLLDLAPQLRPIASAMVVGGFDPAVGQQVRQALSAGADAQAPRAAASPTDAGLRPGDPVGVSLVRGDLEVGATGTVTYVDGSRVYAFGHPFLNLGPTSFAMTKAHVFTVLPSVEASIKIASLGPVIGTLTQDRATAVGGTLGTSPSELEVHLTLASDHAATRQLKFFVLRDQTLTPLFSYVALLNSLTAYERQNGAVSIGIHGTVSFGRDGIVTIDDAFSGDNAVTSAAGAAVASIGTAVANEFRPVLPDRMDLEVRTSEEQRSTTIERVWLDTTKPRFGATQTLSIQLQDYRGARRIVTMPVTMPSHADGPLTLLVSDAPTLTNLEQHDLKPGKATSWPAVLADLNDARRNNRVYVRLIATDSGAVIDGDTLPSLPASKLSIVNADASVSRASVAKTIVGAWEQRLDETVRGSRELTLNLFPSD